MSSVPAVAQSHATSLKADYKVAKAQLLERFKTASNVDSLMAALARATDESLRAAWNTCELPPELALLAVGGYGRGELAPHSDIDILVLLPDAPIEHLKRASSALSASRGIWGSNSAAACAAWRNVVEEAANDVTVRTSLLEARRITGSAPLFDDFAKRYRETLDPARSSRPKCWKCVSGTPSFRTRRIRSNRTSRKARAACAICN